VISRKFPVSLCASVVPSVVRLIILLGFIVTSKSTNKVAEHLAFKKMKPITFYNLYMLIIIIIIITRWSSGETEQHILQ
jgi:hypothetical protein